MVPERRSTWLKVRERVALSPSGMVGITSSCCWQAAATRSTFKFALNHAADPPALCIPPIALAVEAGIEVPEGSDRALAEISYSAS
jgi:hypothetical protein